MAEGRHIGTRPPRQALRGRPWSWITGRPRLVDGFLVAITLVPGLLTILVGGEGRLGAPLLALAIVLVGLKSIPLWWRRHAPLAVVAIVAAAVLVSDSLGVAQSASDGAIILAVYAVSAYGGGGARMWVLVLVAFVTVATFGSALFAVTNLRESPLTLGPPALVAWVVGDFMRSRRQAMADLVARHRMEREQAAEDERLRIARELHDVVAHNVSLIAIQAGAARMSGDSSGSALASIEGTARDTLAELNRLLGVLRKDPEGAAREPQPGLSQVDGLIQPARDAGLDVAVKVSGDVRPLPAALDLSAYRIVQEAITNVLKHANASRVEVVIDYQPEAMVLTVTDNGAGPMQTAEGSSGHGLIGMRERVELFGGELGAGSSSLGGFTVRARLPVT
ncbi:MAG TPA: sensor histidine kinase [Candidatus Dormibacteraeota bacterium]|nr:sensor histidine kinase [Candidatus Dormibacteraeota bacterium]